LRALPLDRRLEADRVRPPAALDLQGKHASVACTACHREVQVADKIRTRQYKGLPTTCAECHVDTHKGAFREFVP